MNDQKRIAIVGLGGIANSHLHFLRECSGGRAIAGADCNPEKGPIFRENQGLPFYHDVEEMLDKEKPDGVLIATPPSQREEVIELALQRSIAVLSEKPLAHTYTSAERIVALAEHYAPVPMHIGYCHRFTAASQYAKRLLADGALGEIVAMQVYFSGDNPGMQSHWMTDRLISGGGAAMDNACHALDLFLYFMGSIASSSGHYRNAWPGRGEDGFAITLRSDCNVLGVVQGSYLDSRPRGTWEIVGTDGCLSYDYAAGGTTLVYYPKGKEEQRLTVAAASLRFAAQLDAWVSAMKGEDSAMATPQEALHVARQLDAIAHANAVGECLSVS